MSNLSTSRRHSLLVLAAFALVFGAHAAAAQKPTDRPCDLLARTSSGPATPCVAAISTTRALYSSYTGPLYQVTRLHDGKAADIGLLPDGVANAAAQDKFCHDTTCVFTKLYDQSPNHNDLTPAPPGGYAHGTGPNGFDVPAVANALPATLSGHNVYGIAIEPGQGYRNNQAKNTAVNGQPEGVYMVTSALHLNEKCCFDFGNAEVDSNDNKFGHMDAINIMYRAKLNAPDVGLDMEDGIPGGLPVPAGTMFVTDMGVNDGQKTYAMYQGDAQGKLNGGKLTSTGTIPLLGHYQPMKQEGAIILGIGGDNSNSATGYFFEGVMTQGEPSAAVMQLLQDNIVAAQYSGKLRP
jgi:hypothetical protein